MGDESCERRGKPQVGILRGTSAEDMGLLGPGKNTARVWTGMEWPGRCTDEMEVETQGCRNEVTHGVNIGVGIGVAHGVQHKGVCECESPF
jgi:hypothetical protein